MIPFVMQSRPPRPARCSCRRRSPRASSGKSRTGHIPALTSRETEVLRWLAAGESNKEIARRLFVSDETIKTHVSSILAKLEVPSRTQAALYAIRVGLIPSRE